MYCFEALMGLGMLSGIGTGTAEVGKCKKYKLLLDSHMLDSCCYMGHNY